ncbi:phage portal protein [Ruminococcaceae bacterium OttesenSCG-928-I18]|nr:phage portal protein [Ruminococcaceae bacterium OttesenSCG-928-I18]
MPSRGAFSSGAGAAGRIYFVTKEVNDEFIEHHLDRLEENIYRFSKTPNLHDEHFAGNASGVAMKYKMAGLETKCGMWQAKMMSAGVYMFRLLCGCWQKKGIAADPLQCVMDFHRNFPLDVAGEAEAVKTLGIGPRVLGPGRAARLFRALPPFSTGAGHISCARQVARRGPPRFWGGAADPGGGE